MECYHYTKGIDSILYFTKLSMDSSVERPRTPIKINGVGMRRPWYSESDYAISREKLFLTFHATTLLWHWFYLASKISYKRLCHIDSNCQHLKSASPFILNHNCYFFHRIFSCDPDLTEKHSIALVKLEACITIRCHPLQLRFNIGLYFRYNYMDCWNTVYMKT